jgi:uncharacterized protein YjeT (DUF2065 family)
LTSLSWILVVVGLVLVLEGAVWMASPRTIGRVLMRGVPVAVVEQLRWFGAIPLLIGAVAVFAAVLGYAR